MSSRRKPRETEDISVGLGGWLGLGQLIMAYNISIAGTSDTRMLRNRVPVREFHLTTGGMHYLRSLYLFI